MVQNLKKKMYYEVHVINNDMSNSNLEGGFSFGPSPKPQSGLPHCTSVDNFGYYNRKQWHYCLENNTSLHLWYTEISVSLPAQSQVSHTQFCYCALRRSSPCNFGENNGPLLFFYCFHRELLCEICRKSSLGPSQTAIVS